MKYSLLLSFLLFNLILCGQTRYDVASADEFQAAQQQANAGDTIAWLPGLYTNTRIEVDKDGLVVTAIPHGSVLFTGFSRAIINGDDVTFSGFQYVGGNIATLDVLGVYGSNALIHEINIQNYTSSKYLVVYESSKNTTISYSNFENRLNLDDKNILSILVDTEPGYHKIQHCSFKNFDGIGNDQGIEPIRIGVSSQGTRDSRTLVEYCYFTRCNGDGEIISHKARQNVYRYNTFEDNPVAELVLRHGDEGVVYGNFFINNMGGIRVREGSDHYIFNNYFQGLDRRAIFLQNDPSDPLSEIHIYHNTIVESDDFILGGSGSNPPTNVTIANNIFANPVSQLFTQDTETETWIDNIYLGTLGIDLPASGLAEVDPMLIENAEGFLQPGTDSPVIAASGDGYPSIPLFPGMDYDHELLLDLMQQQRPVTTTDKAIGASEFSDMVDVQPFATELNTGPSYLFDNLVDYVAANATVMFVDKEGANRSLKISSNIDWTITSDVDWITINQDSGTGDASLVLTIAPNQDTQEREGIITLVGGSQTITVEITQEAGELVNVEESELEALRLYPNPTEGLLQLSNLPLGNYNGLVEIYHLDGRLISSTINPVDNQEILIRVDSLEAGNYLLNVKLLTQSGELDAELTRRFVKR